MSKEYRIVTIANHWPTQDYYCYKSLFKSVGDNEILILGQGQGEYTSLSDKPRILYNAIVNGLIEEEIIVFVDAFDVVFVSPLEEIIQKFKSFDCDILVGAERNCFPPNFKKEYDRLNPPTTYKYLNSGVIIGYKDKILEALEAMDAPNLPQDYHNPHTGRNYHFNDQAMYMDIFLRQPVNIKLDYQCEIVQNMQDVLESDISFDYIENSLSNKPTIPVIINTEANTIPSIIHWNGPSKSGFSMQKILKHLDLTV